MAALAALGDTAVVRGANNTAGRHRALDDTAGWRGALGDTDTAVGSRTLPDTVGARAGDTAVALSRDFSLSLNCIAPSDLDAASSPDTVSPSAFDSGCDFDSGVNGLGGSGVNIAGLGTSDVNNSDVSAYDLHCLSSSDLDDAYNLDQVISTGLDGVSFNLDRVFSTGLDSLVYNLDRVFSTGLNADYTAPFGNLSEPRLASSASTDSATASTADSFSPRSRPDSHPPIFTHTAAFGGGALGADSAGADSAAGLGLGGRFGAAAGSALGAALTDALSSLLAVEQASAPDTGLDSYSHLDSNGGRSSFGCLGSNGPDSNGRPYVNGRLDLDANAGLDWGDDQDWAGSSLLGLGGADPYYGEGGYEMPEGCPFEMPVGGSEDAPWGTNSKPRVQVRAPYHYVHYIFIYIYIYIHLFIYIHTKGCL